MSRRAVAIILVAAFTGAVLALPAEATWSETTLRTWAWEGPVQDRHPLKLAPEEAYDRYYFTIDASGFAVAYFNVRHDATGDSVCSGDLLVMNGNGGYHQCDLRIGHRYTVSVHMFGGEALVLIGVHE